VRYLWNLVIAVLALLAVSSGIAKIMQMPQDVEFFGRYGFNSSMVIGFGVLQLVGGVLLVFKKTRITGSVIVFLTFLLSLVFLLLDANLPFSIASIFAMIALAAVVVRSKRTDYD